jgi:hypothetical protein
VLDPRLYRAALVPVLVAVLVAAFSLENRPRPLVTTLAPDAFDGPGAARTLDALAAAHPDREPGGPGDERLAADVADRLRAVLPDGAVRVERHGERTADGARDLTTVVGTRIGRPGPGLVVVAHRDARGAGARAELSGTAGLLELARVTGEGRLRRTITFISTSGGSAGSAGAARAARGLRGQDVDAVLVLGDLASAAVRKPFVVGDAQAAGHAPLRLQRTVEAAVRAEADTEPGGDRAPEQLAHLALPLTVGEQGPFGRRGLPAVLLSVSGERGPRSADAPVSAARLEAFGRAALRSITALDEGPDLRAGTERSVVTARKVLPPWALRLLVAALLLPVVLVTVDGFARLRRRREPIAPWLRWILAGALPFALTAAAAVALRLVGLLPAPPAPPLVRGTDVDGAALGSLGFLAVVLGAAWAFARPAVLRAGTPPPRGSTPAADGAAISVALVTTLTAVAVWVVNPVAALLLVPAAHLWLAAVSPDLRLRGLPGVLLVLAGLLPFAAVWAIHAEALGLGPLRTLWLGAVMVAGGSVGPLGWLVWSVVAGTAAAAVMVAARRPPEQRDPPREVTVRGPRTYAGPGSLGGTESALRR